MFDDVNPYRRIDPAWRLKQILVREMSAAQYTFRFIAAFLLFSNGCIMCELSVRVHSCVWKAE